MLPFTRYLPIDDAIFSSPLFLTSAGCIVVPAGSAYPMAGHPDLYQFAWEEGRVLPEFSMLWVLAGEGIWETRSGTRVITAGQVGQVFPGQWHRYRPNPTSGWTECWLQFNGRLAHELQDPLSRSEQEPVRTPNASGPFFRQFRELLDDIRLPEFTNSPHYGLRVAGLLGLLHQPPRGEPAGKPLVERALDHIWSYSHRQLSVSEVAERLAVSRRTLERAFTAAGRRSVLEEITRCRVHRAERLLCETRLPLKNVASLAGFGTPEQMRLQFQARHGQSPGRFRQNPL